ncbi:MAG: ABC transporter substrate-binding protein, partial [Gemmatimonadales bacterium]|nr:ABC transporter substrate-binding protein [Gemmatimonadales bacterium]
MRRFSAVTPLGLLELVAFLSGIPPVAGQSITVVSWGGSYGRAVNEGANIPFTEATGIRIALEAYNGGLAQIRAQVDFGSIHWDVVDLEMADAVRGCDEGLLEPIDID